MCRTQLAQQERFYENRKRLSALTKQELESLPDEAVMYKSVGRA